MASQSAVPASLARTAIYWRHNDDVGWVGLYPSRTEANLNLTWKAHCVQFCMKICRRIMPKRLATCEDSKETVYNVAIMRMISFFTRNNSSSWNNPLYTLERTLAASINCTDLLGMANPNKLSHKSNYRTIQIRENY